jgi:hypothetical protein
MCSNSSHSDFTKTTIAREKLERRNNGGNKLMIQDLHPKSSPQIGMDWWRL